MRTPWRQFELPLTARSLIILLFLVAAAFWAEARNRPEHGGPRTAAARRGVAVPPEFWQGRNPDTVENNEAPPSVPVLRTTYNLWLTNFFSAAVLNNPSLEPTHWGRNADFD